MKDSCKVFEFDMTRVTPGRAHVLDRVGDLYDLEDCRKQLRIHLIREGMRSRVKTCLAGLVGIGLAGIISMPLRMQPFVYENHEVRPVKSEQAG